MKNSSVKTEAEQKIQTVIFLLLIVFMLGISSVILAYLERDENVSLEGKKQLFDQEQKIVLQGDTMTVNIYGEIIR